MEPVAIICPVVNLNGTTANSLIEMHQSAWSALEAARGQLRNAHPHPRDWQTVRDPTLYPLADRQAWDRVHLIESIQKELETIIHSLIEQGA